eukprot:UN3893
MSAKIDATSAKLDAISSFRVLMAKSLLKSLSWGSVTLRNLMTRRVSAASLSTRAFGSLLRRGSGCDSQAGTIQRTQLTLHAASVTS